MCSFGGSVYARRQAGMGNASLACHREAYIELLLQGMNPQRVHYLQFADLIHYRFYARLPVGASLASHPHGVLLWLP
jgi:hypothetical protein